MGILSMNSRSGSKLVLTASLVLGTLLFFKMAKKCREWYMNDLDMYDLEEGIQATRGGNAGRGEYAGGMAEGPGYSSQKWGCPRGQVEFEKGCYDPVSKMYKAGKKVVAA